MTIETLISFFGWCTLINYTILLVWFVVFATNKRLLYKLHYLWFKIPLEKFDIIHYSLMAIYKIFIFVFNLTPFLVLKFII